MKIPCYYYLPKKDTFKNLFLYLDLSFGENEFIENAEPTALEAAQMVKYFYKMLNSEKKAEQEKKTTNINNWQWSGKHIKNFQGLDIGIFEKESDGEITYVIVNAGSSIKFDSFWNIRESIVDWSNNIEQPVGLSQDMSDSISFAKKFVNDHPDANIIFVGHSKGGAEAAANAVATGKKAILFNPAKTNYAAYGLDLAGYKNEITSYVVDGEALDYYTGFLPFETPAVRVILGKGENASDFSFNERVARHGIDTIIEILKNKTE